MHRLEIRPDAAAFPKRLCCQADQSIEIAQDLNDRLVLLLSKYLPQAFRSRQFHPNVQCVFE